MVKKSAFTLIELIFAIVVIAIAVVSLPRMNQVIFKGVDNAIVQEAVFAAATQLNEITTAHWDDNSFNKSTDALAKVIDMGECENDPSKSSYRYMPGHIVQKLHRKCLDDNTTQAADANINTIISLDDAKHPPRNIFINTNIDNTGYKRKYKSQIDVSRPAFFDGTYNNAIKKITITLSDVTDNDPGVVVTSLSTYSANIGEVDFYKKVY